MPIITFSQPGTDRLRESSNFISTLASYDEIICPSLTQLEKTFGRRYIKAILGSANSKNIVGSDIIEGITYEHTHNGSGSRRYSTGTSGRSWLSQNITPKYIMLGNQLKNFISTKWSVPLGVIFVSDRKMFFGDKFQNVEDKYLYVGGSSDAGSVEHNHTVNLGTNYTFTGSASYFSYIMSTTSNEIVDRAELFMIESITYNSSLDFTSKGTIYFQHKTQSVPAGYSEVVITPTGLVRFANSIGEIQNTGGSDSHNHNDSGAGGSGAYDTTTHYYISSITTNDHMPPYIAVRLIQKD